MANTYVDSIATASQTDFAFSFSYLKAEHVKVEINGVDTAAFTLVTSPSNKVVLNSGATAGQVVRVRRNSQPDTNLVDFVNGSVLTETELDFAYQHNRFLNEELAELNEASLQIGPGGTDWDAKSNKILNVSTPTLTADAATKNYVDQKVEQIAAGASTPPSKWQFTGTAGANTTYTVTDADVLGDSAYDVSVNGLVKEPTVDYTVDPDTDTLTIIPSLAGGEDIVIIQRGLGIPLTQGTIGTAQINDGAVTNAKLANTSVTSAKILDGSVTTNKLATNAVTTTEILDDAVTPSKLDETQAYTVNGLASNGSNILITRGAEGPGIRLTYDAVTDEVRDFFVDSSGNFQFTNFSGTGSQGTLMTLDGDGDASITGKVGIGTSASSTHALKVDGNVLVQDTTSNSPAIIIKGSNGGTLQLNDSSSGGQIFNISSSHNTAGTGSFSLGHIGTLSASVSITQVASTSTSVTFQTSSAHGFKEGNFVILSGSSEANWNEQLEIIDIVSTTQFKVQKVSSSTSYPNSAAETDTYTPFTIRRHEDTNKLFSMIKMFGLPQGTTEPSWLEQGQLWIDTTDNSIKIKPEVHS